MSEHSPLILVIEDEPQMTRFLRMLLAGQSYRVIEAMTAAEGIALAASHGPEVVLLDLGLPDGDGLVVTSSTSSWSCWCVMRGRWSRRGSS